MSSWNYYEYKKNTWLLLLIMAPLAFFQLKYRFNHTEMTETQLLLHFWDAFFE